MIQAVIIEDEKPSARRLQRMLEKLEVEVIAHLTSVDEAIKWFLKNPQPELIFLDIQLSDGLSFEIFDHLEINSPIIFTTAYDEYALKAFKLNSVDYLLKPIESEELEAALSKFSKNAAPSSSLQLQNLKSLLNLPSSDYKRRFSIQVGQHLKLIHVNEICCFYSENKATYLRTKENRSYLLEYSLDKLESMLDPALFFRVNRKFIISLDFIGDILTYSNTRLEVKLREFADEQIIVSRERVKDFKEWLDPDLSKLS